MTAMGSGFERGLRDSLREVLDAEPLPHPSWSDSPAARRVAERDMGGRRWPLRLLAIAAVVAIGGAAVGVGALLYRQPPQPPSQKSNGWVAYTTYSGVDYDVTLHRADLGTRSIGLGGDGIYQMCPQFSPDGRTLAYTESSTFLDSAFDWSIAIAALGEDGLPSSRPLRIAIQGPGSCPHWSPDGRQLSFIAPSGLRVVTPDEGSNVRVAGGDWAIGPSAWLPDSTGLLYTRELGDENRTSELWLATETGEDRQLMSGVTDEQILSLTLAPDGARLLVSVESLSRTPDGGTQPSRQFIRQIDVAAGSDVEEIDSWSAGGLISGPVWSPDGNSFAYVRHGELVVRVVGSDPRPLAIEGLDKPGTPACLNGWSPAGDRLLVLVGDADFIDRGVRFSLVSVDPAGIEPTEVVRPWGGLFGACGVTSWQAEEK